MDITINTTTIATKGKKLAITLVKWMFLSVFSTGWLVALGAVIVIPTETLKREVENTKRAVDASDRYAKLLEAGANATPQERESTKHALDLFKQLDSTRPDRQLQALAAVETSATILCVWLALVIVFWLWRLEMACSRFNAGVGCDSLSPKGTPAT
jgi:hypothetical protein